MSISNEDEIDNFFTRPVRVISQPPPYYRVERPSRTTSSHSSAVRMSHDQELASTSASSLEGNSAAGQRTSPAQEVAPGSEYDNHLWPSTAIYQQHEMELAQMAREAGWKGKEKDMSLGRHYSTTLLAGPLSSNAVPHPDTKWKDASKPVPLIPISQSTAPRESLVATSSHKSREVRTETLRLLSQNRKGPASSLPATRPLPQKPDPPKPEPDIFLPLVAYCVGNYTFPETAGEDAPSLSIFLPTRTYRDDTLVLEIRRVHEDSRPVKVVEIKCEHLERVELPEKLEEHLLLTFFFKNQQAEKLLSVLRAGVQDETRKDRDVIPETVNLCSRKQGSKDTPPRLTVRIKPDDGEKCSDVFKKQLERLRNRIKLDWKGVAHGVISGACGQAKLTEFDEALDLYIKGRIANAARINNIGRKKATFQTTLALPAKASTSDASPKPSRTSKAPEVAAQSTRRSNRNSTAAQSQMQEPLKPFHPKDDTPTDKVILIWPHEGVGAVSVTHGDKLRLRDEEFLNDTLIELGLKRISEALSTKDPQAAKEVHMFNSFFYKKLSTKEPPSHHAGTWDAYSTVRKWTAKFDIFDKKFVIVPINEHLHWFLAIIINPGAILAASTKRVTQNSTIAASIDNEDAAMDGSHAISQLAIDEDDGKIEPKLSADFSASVSRTQGSNSEVKMSVDEDGALTFGALHEPHSDADMIICDSDDEDNLTPPEKPPGAVDPLVIKPSVDYSSSPESDEPTLPPIAPPSLAPNPLPPLPSPARNVIPTLFAPSPKAPHSRAPPQDTESHLVQQLAADEEFAQRLSAAGY
ncbi:hypothetical protein P7C70_g8811, partial [Phenoliferia sp. Uapishka_3]